MKDWLTRLKGKKYIGVVELSAQAAEILAGSSSYQEKGTVTEYPDERTIRYYIAENLIPPSTEKQGTATVFGYEHLLALLSIKKLQAQNLTIRKIREILAGKTTGEIEKLFDIDAEDSPSAKNEAQRYLETLLLPRGIETIAKTQQPSFSSAAPVAFSGAGNQPKASQSWERFEIEEGLELHIEKNFKPPSGFSERHTLIKVIEKIIQTFGAE